MQFLKGYKTYVAGILLIMATGADIILSQKVNYQDILMFASGLGFIGLRSAINEK
jgi:hypothetical protein